MMTRPASRLARCAHQLRGHHRDTAEWECPQATGGSRSPAPGPDPLSQAVGDPRLGCLIGADTRGPRALTRSTIRGSLWSILWISSGRTMTVRNCFPSGNGQLDQIADTLLGVSGRVEWEHHAHFPIAGLTLCLSRVEEG